jgi:hypothetical protein
VEDVDFLVGEVAPPLVDHGHEAKLARGEISNGAGSDVSWSDYGRMTLSNAA